MSPCKIKIIPKATKRNKKDETRYTSLGKSIKPTSPTTKNTKILNIKEDESSREACFPMFFQE